MPKTQHKRIKIFYFVYLLCNLCLRIIISYIDKEHTGNSVEFMESLLAGTVSDSIAFLYLLPISLVFHNFNCKFATFLFAFVCVFFSISEYLFWCEFSSRFNFIAVDYLVYTHETIGNIKESYNIQLIIIIALAVATLITCVIHKKVDFIKTKRNYLTIAAPILAYLAYDGSDISFSSNRYTNEISKNGLYELFSAYMNNSLSMEKFYTPVEEDKAIQTLRKVISLDEANTKFVNDSNIHRVINTTGPEKRLNVVVITVESLSYEYINPDLTPHLHAILQKSLFFDNVIAIGTRTVYGLAAISLSIPPLPGNSIVRRPHNERMFTFWTPLRERGYVCKFIYGGYGYFDNMNHFFSENGCEAIDRSCFSKEEITFSNIWGVCDGDLFNKAIKEIDKSSELGKPSFSLIMTTSNHRPFTYPDNKIDIPSKTGRNGAVKYTDLAIGEFLTKSQSKPWFKNTIFVIIADHAADSAGKISLDPHKYHIPLIIYSPDNIEPAVVRKLASQIDVAPTVLRLMNISYTSKFFGHDILSCKNERAFISNYQQIGYIKNNCDLCILKPIRKSEFFKKTTGSEAFETADANNNLLNETISHIKCADAWEKCNKLELR